MPSNVSLRTRFQSLIVGRMSVDVLSNAQRRNVRTAGGSGLHAAFASSLLARTALVSLTGRNFPRSVLSTLRGRVDTSGVTVDRTRDCNEWVGYYQDLDVAQTSRYTENIPETSLNIPEALRESACVFLAAMHPALQLEVLSQLDNPAVVMVDTIRGFVKHEPERLREVIQHADVVCVNQEEAALLCETQDPYLAIDRLLSLGPKAAIVKLGSRGAMMATGNLLFRLPAYNDNPVDTTGAGDSFGGAFVGYLTRQLQTRGFIDNLAFGEAFLMASVMTGFTVEDFGSARLQTLHPQELFSRFLWSRASLLAQGFEVENRGRLNGNILLDIFGEPEAMLEETFATLVSGEYFPGPFALGEAEGSLELPGMWKTLDHKLKPALKAAALGGAEEGLLARYGEAIAELSHRRPSYFSLTEALYHLGRLINYGDRDSTYTDPFGEANQKAHRMALEMAESLPASPSTRDWMLILAAANAFEMYSTKPKYEAKVDAIREVVASPQDHALALDATDLFETRVMQQPTKVAYFTDNHGETDIDLRFILELARRYEAMDPEGDWTIGIVPKALPTATDATRSSVLACITEEGSPVAELQRFLLTGRVRVLSGGSKTQGLNLPHLSQQVGDFLRDVQQSDGVAILKGEANALTSGGLEIDSFLLFKAKSPQMVLAAGIDLNEHALAYLPAGVNGVVGLANGVRQNLADVLEAAQNTPNLAEVLVQVKARMQRTGEPFIDALAKLASPSEPMFRGELAANYVRPIIEDPAVKGSKPVFVARGTMPFKVAWDALAQRNRAVPASHAFMPKIGVVPRYSLAEMITQMLTPEEMERRLSGRSFRRLAAAFRALPEPIRTQIESELGHPFAELSGRTRGEIVSALANIGIDERCYQALALFEQLEAEKGKRPQDRDPNIRSRIKGLYAESKGNTQHAVRPLLNLLLGGTNFGRFSRRNSILFMDEAGSTGSTVNSAELIIRAFHDAATWKFYTVQPTKDTTGLYDGDSRIRFKPEENNPKLYDMLFFGTGNGRLHRSLGTRLTYAEAEIELEVKVSAPNLYEESLRVYNENVTAFLRRHYGEIFDGIRRLNSRHAREVLKMILRRREPGLEASIAEIIVKEEMVPNHTKHRYTIRGELGKLEKRIVALLRADQDTRITLSLLDADISTEDSIETLKRWQENFDRHREDIIRGAE